MSAPIPTAWLPCPGKTKAMRSLTLPPWMPWMASSVSRRATDTLLGAGPLRLDVEHLPAAVRAAVGAGVVREPHLAALGADGELGNLDLVMRPAVALAPVGVAFLRQCAHDVLLDLNLLSRYAARGARIPRRKMRQRPPIVSQPRRGAHPPIGRMKTKTTTEEHRGTQRNTEEHRGTQRNSEEHSGTQRFIEIYGAG